MIPATTRHVQRVGAADPTQLQNKNFAPSCRRHFHLLKMCSQALKMQDNDGMRLFISIAVGMSTLFAASANRFQQRRQSMQ